MSMYDIRESKEAQRALRKMAPKLAKQIRSKVQEVAHAPHKAHNNVTRLKGSPYYSLRVGDWRVIYEIRDEELVMLVLHVKPRGDAYDAI